MKSMQKLLRFLRPYWLPSIITLSFIFIVVILDLLIPRLVQDIIDFGINGGDMASVGQTVFIMLIISITSTALSIAQNTISVRVAEFFARDLREALFKKIQSLSFGNLDNLQTGRLVVRLTSDITVLQRVTRMSLRIGTRAPLLMVGSIILMYSTNQQLTLTLAPLFILTMIVIAVFVVNVGPVFVRVQRMLDSLNTVLQENIAGIRVVKSFVRQDHEHKRFGAVNQDYAEINTTVMRYSTSLLPILTIMLNLGSVIVVWAGGIQYSNDTVTTGQIVAFANYLLTTLTPIAIMGNIANVFAGGTVSADRICEVLEMEPDVQDQMNTRTLPENVQGKVEFRNVTFHYNGAADQPVLQNINFTVQPGQIAAILGSTGAGKSSLVNLIPRFYDPVDGEIFLDGIDLKEYEHSSLLAQFGIALQESILFSGNIRENISFGNPSATDAEIEEAARAACAHDFIMAFPDGYDTHIEARGINLSGGQKQRIAIARAILLKPTILILDDSTSAVDVETETNIQNALEALMAHSTTFIVAQRISTVLTADKILVLDKGRLAAEGTHKDLLQTSLIYQEIFKSQLGSGVNEHQRSAA